jgi:glycosyltransferase involved in cell wall biosynthesis
MICADMDVALIGEGAYPHQLGGVSVWCDQLIRGMGDYRFRIVALVATGREPMAWQLPDNVASNDVVPLWGPPSTARVARRRARSSFVPLLRRLIDIVLSPPDERQHEFAEVLQEIYQCAKHDDLEAGLDNEEGVRVISDAWRDRWPDVEQPSPNLHDAVTALRLLEHSLRPLSRPPVHVDLTHVATNGLGALPALAAKWEYGTPMLVTEHGVALREHYLHNRNGPYRWPVRKLYSAYLRRLCALGFGEAEMIASGNLYNRRWQAQLGADETRTRTVYNGVDPAWFLAFPDEPEAPTISWIGRIEPLKDLETLLRSFEIVLREMPEARLRLFGWAPFGQEVYLRWCQELAGELGLGDAVTFEGRVQDSRTAFAAGQVAVLSSISEGFPYTLIEAMACGRPCVATDVGGVTEALGSTGLVVPPRQPDDMARACLTLLRDVDLRRRLGSAARTRVLELFTLDRALGEYREIYIALTSGCPLPIEEPGLEPDALLALGTPG